MHLFIAVYWMMPCWWCSADVLGLFDRKEVFDQAVARALEVAFRCAAELASGLAILEEDKGWS
jgi:hypothetical protein